MLSSYRSLFSNRNYALLWLGQTGSVVGDALYHVAFYWLAYSLSGSPVVAGLVIFAGTVPYLFFGLLGGVYADRWPRVRLMIGCDALRAVVVGTVPLLALSGPVPVWVLGAVAFVLTSVRCFFYPAVKSTVADVLSDPERGLGVACLQASMQAAKVLGTAAGGLLIAASSAEAVYALPVLTYGFSLWALWRLRIALQPAQTGTPPPAWRDIADTIRLLRPERALFWSIALFGLGLLCITGIDRIALPALSDRVWQVGADGLGIVMAAFAVGNVVASLALGHATLRRPEVAIFWGWALWGVFYALLGLSPVFGWAVAFAFLAGVSEAFIDVPLVLLIQTRVARERMGKVFSMWSTVAFIGESGSALIAGLVVGAIGPSQAYVAAGAGLVMVAMAGLFLTRRRTGANPMSAAPMRTEP